MRLWSDGSPPKMLIEEAESALYKELRGESTKIMDGQLGGGVDACRI